jgi:hypothetical protein
VNLNGQKYVCSGLPIPTKRIKAHTEDDDASARKIKMNRLKIKERFGRACQRVKGKNCRE